jgi:hypothetical protein
MKKFVALLVTALMVASTLTVFRANAQEFQRWNPFEGWTGDDFYEYFEGAGPRARDMPTFNEFFPPFDLEGITVSISHLGWPEEFANEALRDERIAWTRFVEMKYNITLHFVPEIHTIEEAQRSEQVIASVMAGDPMVDIFFVQNVVSAQAFQPLVNAGVLRPDCGWIAENIPPNWYAGWGEADGQIFGLEPNFVHQPNNMMLYNREMILRAGMEYTPSEMFRQGRWGYEDFIDYLLELDMMLPYGVHPIGIQLEHFLRALVFANGWQVVDPATNLPTYLDERYIEPVRLLQTLFSLGLMPTPVLNADDVWIGGTEATHANFVNGNIAIGWGERWQWAGVGANIDFGIVGFPWGPNVAWPESDYWRDLAYEGYTTRLFTAWKVVLLDSAPAGLTWEIAAGIIYSVSQPTEQAIPTPYPLPT